MDGVVKSAGTVDESVSDEDFIVVTGASGMYVQGTISETKLDTVKVGDQVSGMSYDTGMSFTATITEISQYPTSGDNVYYGDGTLLLLLIRFWLTLRMRMACQRDM